MSTTTASSSSNSAPTTHVAAAPLRVVFDTNVLLSLYAFSDSRFRGLRTAVQDGRLTCLTRTDCLAEFERVLAYRSLRVSEARRVEAYAAYREHAQLVDVAPAPVRRLPVCKDRDDQKFLELARDGAAQYLVTLDGCLLGLAQRMKAPGDAQIVVPQRMLAIVEALTAPN